MELRASEWIVIAYFAYLAGAAAIMRSIGRQQRLRVIATAIIVLIAALMIARFGTSAMLWREWMPLVYIVIGYRLPALLVTRTNQVFEVWLLSLDRHWRVTQNSARAPGLVLELLELAYLCCYPMLPVGFACLYFAGLHAESDRFWTAVLLAVFGCYGVLPWLPTRPPRAIEGAPMLPPGPVRRLNLRVLGLASVQLNTFPSGHAAGSLATALAVGAHLPSAGVPLGLLALAISIASVVGRYHYAADALAGAALALLGFLISRAV